ncbi:DUF3299 domain-containing protein [Marinobacter orientalis]|uniref:DUF3299 domain-containing protein n=2 Tax=Marinobacter orientalis TaxID=1928859 RepID=A0A7Y0NJU5_9GAMM|nr:DUF3299 domain-containing protein [Marinobacter orientalis]NMT62344.1 DUF3299 domain-containing protein [Marinobacter orientalis]TGX51050.1 DUF3299 domain-containing protein [Marinobacter orientalis]
MRSVLPLLALVLAVSLSLFTTASAEDASDEIDWLELMPAEDLNLLENMPEVTHEGDGPAALPDEIMTGRTVDAMDGRSGRIPGFVVPLKTTRDMRILEFFLVPYYGACIHVPPPPPNQIIHVKYKEGFTLEALYDPVWIEGTLTIEKTENDIASSSYSIVAENVTPYEEEGVY